MSKSRNVLWIMCDQLRWDYLSCYGHPHLDTPNIDRLAQRGVRFTRAYVQSPVCGPSRMSYYTGRYMRSHGSNWNQHPLRVGEPTLGDALRKIGVRNVLVGKTHMRADIEGMARLGIDPGSDLGVLISECGFEPYERDDGLHPTNPARPRPSYDSYLTAKGYDTDNPWELHANSGRGADGSVRNGWMLLNSGVAADVAEDDSETPYMTRRAMDFIREAKDDPRPWCLHLSYIKPHWPYVAPAPYNDMYGRQHILRPVRSEGERANAHPVFQAFMDQRVGKVFSRDDVRETVIPAYMGLIKQIDDQLGLLFRFLDEEGLAQSTMIVFTSDHGDYLGDHWLGEKDLFHDCSARVPLLIYDPSPEADATRGTVNDRLVEAIDLAPSFVDYFGGKVQNHVMEGRSLLPLLHGERPTTWRDYAFSEYDYAMLEAREVIGRPVDQCRLFMVFDGRWKLIHAPGMDAMLYDLENDPDEFDDRGREPACAEIVRRLRQALFDWALEDHNRITFSDAQIAAYGAGPQLKSGIIIGYADEADVARARKQYGLD